MEEEGGAQPAEKLTYADLPVPKGTDAYFHVECQGTLVSVLEPDLWKKVFACIRPEAYALYKMDAPNKESTRFLESSVVTVTRGIAQTVFLPVPVYSSPLLMAFAAYGKAQAGRPPVSMPAVTDSFQSRFELQMLKRYVLGVFPDATKGHGGEPVPLDRRKARIEGLEEAYREGVDLALRDAISDLEDITRAPRTPASLQRAIERLRVHTVLGIQMIERFIYDALRLDSYKIPLSAVLTMRRMPDTAKIDGLSQIKPRTLVAEREIAQAMRRLQEGTMNSLRHYLKLRQGLWFAHKKQSGNALFPSLNQLDQVNRYCLDGVLGYLPAPVATDIVRQFVPEES